MAKHRTSLRNLSSSDIDFWAHRGEAFEAASMSGSKGQGSPGRLDEDWAYLYKGANVAYTVYSYATPIAWLTAGGDWVVPTQKFSVSTSRHQGIVRGL